MQFHRLRVKDREFLKVQLRHLKIPRRFHSLICISWLLLARRRAAAKRKKLKNLGKSKSTDTEEEDADDDCGDDGELNDAILRIQSLKSVDWLTD